ncbi:MAG: hypothetical protein V4546_05560 [Bacteroidota bacterium]|uniref:hypothetical protein n=1 Tax=Sediminibacterium sp. TaxID=1917865 RepID=UPI000BC4AFAA|nr:hypothetical protein [Sediminibacterium sp.]OYZ55433.1 MAG: hypothetical protein B7Y11_01460 [Sphingobacteriia bacterium 24-36-13]OZA66344.1 MAG: hypothetical protein B7X68_00945 [Sphingobacteriia bacterium 39-36-14]HQS22853.1 hypothetical protein [Sediminibacterium sp.]HQS33970.1 hypothetical protein [Sediminibacterium sp.]
MAEINHPILDKKKIIRATIISMIIGVVLLVTAVLPAEYGIDPTGAGKLFGFSRLYIPENTTSGTMVSSNFPLIKMEKAGSGPDVKRPSEADNPAPEIQLTQREDSVQVIVPAGKGLEYKIYMLKHGKMKYEWTTNNGVLYFDFHGEVKQAKATKAVYFESYTIANSNNMVGTFLSPYEGKHGWFFRNNGSKDVTVTLRLKGQYEL